MQTFVKVKLSSLLLPNFPLKCDDNVGEEDMVNIDNFKVVCKEKQTIWTRC